MDKASHLVFSPAYNTDLPAFGLNKPFALDRGELVLKALEEEFGQAPNVISPQPLDIEDVLLVHSLAYLESLEKDETWFEIFELKAEELKREISTKALPELIEDFLLKSGGTLEAARLALKHGLAANLGAGYHHAFPDQGRGYCVINDIAIAIRKLQKEKLIKTAMIVDLDFHQGDGTAKTFRGDKSVFTLSVHSQEGWPEVKQESSLDVGILESEKNTYLERTKVAVNQALSQFTPDLVIFVAGSDVYEKDILPGTKYLRLPLSVLKERDQFVIDTFKQREIPLAMVFAGGYGPHVWEVHHQAVRHLLLVSDPELSSRIESSSDCKSTSNTEPTSGIKCSVANS
jgi:acetoin utilization deacetylase AcuC-like enzyme